MPTTPYSTNDYLSRADEGGGLQDLQYDSPGVPYVDKPTYSRSNLPGRELMGDPISKGINKIFGFGQKKKKSSLERWQKLANKEWAQGNAALSAYSRLYEPTLNMARRQAADYGDLYRRASNDQLAFDIRSATTKRQGDLADFKRLGGDYVSQLRETNPLLAQYFDTTQSNYAFGSKMSPEQEAAFRSSVGEAQARRGMGRGPTDIYQEAVARSTYGENLRQNRASEARDALGLYGDIFQATTGRPTMSATPMGATIQAPDANIGLQDYLSMGINFDQQRMNANANKKAQQQAMIGAGIQAVAGIGGAAVGMCWVAREVYGETNPKWKEFRHYLFTRAPAALLRGYLRKGAAFADWLRSHPERKADVRAWMDTCLGEPVEAAAA